MGKYKDELLKTGRKRRFAICGTSNRGLNTYGRPLADAQANGDVQIASNFGYGSEALYKNEIQEVSELVGVFDSNIGRAKYVANELGVEAFEDFDEMIQKAKPDCIIVTTTDYAHAEYIIRALDAGCDVWTEKPMCINAEQCRAILEAERRNNRKIGVCFNVRYGTYGPAVKKVIDSGVLGEIYNVHAEWILTKDYSEGNSGHGASYYRRWNVYMNQSGGLLLHKSTHHFDFINWLIGGRPKRVSAFGKLRHYGKNGAYRGERCSNCEHAEKCPFYVKTTPFMQKMYVNNEKYDGYKIDRCVFDEAIDTYDTMALNVEYDNGVVMTYSENSAGMYEGFRIMINGSDARMEVCSTDEKNFIKIFKTGKNNVITIPHPPAKSGDHGGGDDAFRRVLYLGEDPEFEGQRAGAIDGAYSILIGAAANVSIATGKVVEIDELIGDPTLLDKE